MSLLPSLVFTIDNFTKKLRCERTLFWIFFYSVFNIFEINNSEYFIEYLVKKTIHYCIRFTNARTIISWLQFRLWSKADYRKC